ncbi:MAG: metal-dependent transcriptional regulator [Caldisericaceae bacterium]
MKSTKGIEDYLEAIYVLSMEEHHTHIKAIAQFLGVKLPSVTEAVCKLVSLGYAVHDPYGSVSLTEKGKKIGRATWDKHQLLYKFFKDVLGISNEVAVRDACLVEHSISNETKIKIEKYMEHSLGRAK